MAQLTTHALLADALLQCVREQDFLGVKDTHNLGKDISHFPSLDLAVVAFPRESAPVWANVLFSRDFPQGIVAELGPAAGAVANVHYLQDQTNAVGDSIAWYPTSDWNRMIWESLAGSPASAHRFVSPYPASLIKLMVAIGVGRIIDTGQHLWEDFWRYGGHQKTIAAWTESMVVASNNEATSAMVALLHAEGLIVREGAQETNHLNRLLADLGLNTLRLSDTQPDGGWRNGDGAGVGHLHMTAWDTLRLLWLLRDSDTTQAAPPWLAVQAEPLLLPNSRKRLWGFLADQGLHEILSSTALARVPGWQAGIPAQLPSRWVMADGSVQVEHAVFPADVRASNAQAEVHFAHKTGTTDNYASDAGQVTSLQAHGRRYLIAITTNLGRRYAPHALCATDWKIPRLGARVDAWLKQQLE